MNITVNFNQAQLETTEREAEALAKATQGIQCVSAEQAEAFADIIRSVRAEDDANEALRKSVTGPILESKAMIDSWFKPSSNWRKQTIANLKAAIERYTVEADRAAAAALRAGAELHLAGDFGGAVTALAVANEAGAIEAPAGVTVVEYWAPEVSQPELVPREYCDPSIDRIKAVAPKSTDTAPPHIPGVIWSRKTRSVVR